MKSENFSLIKHVKLRRRLSGGLAWGEYKDVLDCSKVRDYSCSLKKTVSLIITGGKAFKTIDFCQVNVKKSRKKNHKKINAPRLKQKKVNHKHVLNRV